MLIWNICFIILFEWHACKLALSEVHYHYNRFFPERVPIKKLFFTFSVLGCILSSKWCFFLSSISSRLLYSSWLVHSVWCWFCCWSLLSLWTELKCLNSISCVHSWCLISMLWDSSSWLSNLFISCVGEKGHVMWDAREYRTTSDVIVYNFFIFIFLGIHTLYFVILSCYIIYYTSKILYCLHLAFPNSSNEQT